jgi:hypothetical protein
MASFLKEKPGPFRRGAPIRAEPFNRMRDAIPRQLRGGEGMSVSDYSDRQVIVLDKPPQVTLADPTYTVAPFSVVQELDDLLKCQVFMASVDPSNGWWKQVPYQNPMGQTPVPDPNGYIYVAKPYLLQKTPWDGQTVTLSDGVWTYKYSTTGPGVRQRAPFGSSGDGQTQSITQSYFQNDVISAVRCFTGIQDPDNKIPVIWQDLNEGARAWSTPASGLALIQVVSASADGTSGMYPAQLLKFNDGAPVTYTPDTSTNVWAWGPSGGALTMQSYVAYLAGTHAVDGKSVYAPAGTVINGNCVNNQVTLYTA